MIPCIDKASEINDHIKINELLIGRCIKKEYTISFPKAKVFQSPNREANVLCCHTQLSKSASKSTHLHGRGKTNNPKNMIS